MLKKCFEQPYDVYEESTIQMKKNAAELGKVVELEITLKISATVFEVRTMTLRQLIERYLIKGN